MSVQKLVTSLNKKLDGPDYVGEKNRLFFDLATRSFRLSDGVTPGGIVLQGGGGGGGGGLTGITDFATSSVVELTDTQITITGATLLESDEAVDPVTKYEYVLYGTTVNNTVTELYRDSFNNKIILDNNTTYFYEIDVIGRGNAGTDHAAIQFTGAINVSNSGIMSKINEQKTTISSGPGFDLDAIIGLTSNDKSLNVSGSGRPSTTVRWTALVKLIEVKQI